MSEAPWLAAGRKLLGVSETPGPKNNPVIMGWADKLGVKIMGARYGADSVPWCGLFAAHCMRLVGLAPPAIALRAKSWATWGVPGPAGVGAVLVFIRDGGGHVGFYVAEDKTAYHVLGGNQGDRVSILRISKDRCTAIRWPKGYVPAAPRIVKSNAPLSVNEA